MKTIDEQIKEKEAELEALMNLKEKQESLRNGALKALNNNILEDVVISEYETIGTDGRGTGVSLAFKLNGKLIDVNTNINDTEKLKGQRGKMGELLMDRLTRELFKYMVNNK